MTMISVNEFKNGLTIEYNNDLWRIVEFQHVKPGKGSAFVRSKLKSLRTGTYTAAILAAVLAAPLTYIILGNMGVYVAILCGLIGGYAIGYFTEYYTSDTYKPTQ